MDPFVERDAFINQLNQQRMQNQIAFNSGGMTDPTAGMTPGLNYQQAMQQAGLGGGAPSMAANYGDSMISRLNQAFGGQGDPFAFANQQPQFAGIYAPGTDVTKLPFTDTMQPNPAYRPQVTPLQQPAGPYTSTTYAYPDGTWGHSPQQGQPQSPAMAPQAQASIPSQGTLPSWAAGSPLDQPPGAMNWGDWARIQQQQGSPAVAQAPYTPPTYSPVSTVGTPPPPPSGPANPYGAPVTDRPAPPPQVPQAKDQNRAKFLQDKAAGKGDAQFATYDDYVKAGLDNAVGQVLSSPTGAEWYSQYQSADPAKKKAYGDRLQSLIYSTAAQRGVDPGSDWFAGKSGGAGNEGKDKYFNDAMARYSAKQSPVGKAQSIQPQSQGTPYGQLATSLPNTFKPYDGPVGRPWWELPGAGRLTAGDPIVPGYSFRNGHAWDMQMLEPTRGPDYGQANSNVYNAPQPASPPAAPAKPSKPAATTSVARPWQAR
jgi:hypothetical protein